MIQPLPTTTRSPEYGEVDIPDLLATIAEQRRQLAEGAAAYEALRESAESTHAALVDLVHAVQWLATPSRHTGPLEGGRLHKVSGPAFRAAADLLAMMGPQ